jgi:hypothetical protein
VKLRPNPSTAAVARVGRTRHEYRLTGATNRLAATFTNWQQSYVRRLAGLDAERRFALGALLTMAIAERTDLEGIATSGVIYQAQDGPTLEWHRPDGRRGARALSSLLAVTLAPDFDPRCGGRFLSVLDAALRDIDPALHASADPIEAAVACSEAWIFQEATEFLSHVTSDLPMTPLPRSAFARLESRQALATHFETRQGENNDTAAAVAGFLQSKVSDEDKKVLDKIVEETKLRDVATKSDAQLLEDLAAVWRGQIDAAESAGPLTSLQLGCALQLAYAAEHKPATIVGYVRDGFPVVHDALAGKELVALTAEQLSLQLASSLEKVDGQKRRNARAYLGHLWRFAREWIDVEPLLPSLLPDVDVGQVDANVVWEHEGQRMDGWLAGPQLDPELARQTRLVRRLLVALKARVSEVFFLQVRSVHIHDNEDFVDVEIVFRGRLHGLKSKDAQRTVRVHGALAAELVGQVNRRLLEDKCLSSHLLFGTKAEPDRVYRLGAMYSWLNRAVKAATGDPTSCCHHFRHTGIDGAYAAMSLADIYAGALEQLRVDAGHLDLRSTQRSYLHRFACHLREAVEVSLEECVKFSDSQAAPLVGIKPAALRKQRSRANANEPDCVNAGASASQARRSAWYWCIVRSAARQRTFEPASAGFALCSPLPPKPLGAARPWSVVDLIEFLGDLQHGDTPAQACRQRRIPAEIGEVVVSSLLSSGQKALREGRRPTHLQLASPQAALAALKLRVVAAFQPKYAAMRRALAAEPPPHFPDEAWDEWTRSSKGQYIKLSPVQRPERWLTLVLQYGLPASKLRVCIDEGSSAYGLDVRRLMRTASALALATGGSVRYEPCSYNDRRGRSYLLVADEAETLTEHSGAAFSPAGLRVILLAMRLASHAHANVEGVSS